MLGYAETTAIFEDICLLTCYGTAARCSWAPSPHTGSFGGGPFPPLNTDPSEEMVEDGVHAIPQGAKRMPACAVFHTPYNYKNAPFSMNLAKCGVCGEALVPEMVLSTTEPHDRDRDSQEEAKFPMVGFGRLIEARVCRSLAHLPTPRSRALACCVVILR